ncbi:uncharacterized protein FIESC28_04003 [Fusarium coffeatum]|uniref:Mid2 domain-containing protein n=1 Tax=Fusarium coffeatum TaxID=231269 RepID=A0A366S1T0_9HYPO|nr:uncharacterized protein FIESC28_04003 [Fusarium coffeatum]RBR23261.1 hypothetical protein FIESC28_04003 [Fusarium coffeatum]
MEHQQDPPDDASSTTLPQHRNKPRSYIDTSGKFYETIPPGLKPAATVPAWTSVYRDESGRTQTFERQQLTYIERAPADTAHRTGDLVGSTYAEIFTIILPPNSPASTDTTTSKSTKSTVVPSISILPHSPWWTQIDGTATTSESGESSSITQTSQSSASTSSIRSVQSTTLSQNTESPDATTISASSHNDPSSSSSDTTSSSWSDTTSSAEWSWPTESSIPEPSTSNAEWAGVIVGAVFAFMIIILILIAFVVRGRRNASSRENQNNINIRLDNGPFDHHHGPYNCPLAETNPGCVPQGWDDVRQ